MQFQVPQFIEVEDTIVGPFTFKQLIFILGGAGSVYLLYRFLPSLIAWPLMILVAVFAWALVFYKYNDRPFIIAVENAVKFHFSNKLYLWNKQQKQVVKQLAKTGAVIPQTMAPTMTQNKLKELSWSLDINDTLSK